MRARNLKPALFKNEILGTSDPLYTILFEGLWCLADRAGRLEDRALRIKAEVLPYRDGLDIDALLSWLHDRGFIVRYLADGSRLIQILKFLEHQSPHKNEVPSVLPEWDGSKHNHGCSDLSPKTAPLALTPSSLTPDSGLLTPDSLVLTPEPGARESTTKVRSASGQGSKVSRDVGPEWFLDFKLVYPNRAGDQNWNEATRRVNARLKEGHTAEQILDGAQRYAAYCVATESVDTQFVKQASVFVGTEKHFLKPWDIPAGKADRRLNQNLDVMAQFVAGSGK